MHLGDKAVKKPRVRHAWSKQLREAAYACQYWQHRKKMLAYRIESDEKMDVLRQIAGIKRADL